MDSGCFVVPLLSLCLVGRWCAPSAPYSYSCSPKPLQSSTSNHHTVDPALMQRRCIGISPIDQIICAAFEKQAVTRKQ